VVGMEVGTVEGFQGEGGDSVVVEVEVGSA